MGVNSNDNLDRPVLTEQKKEYNRLVGLVKKEYGKVETSSLNIAFALHQIYAQELYLIDGFKNISECGEEQFNLGKTTVNSFINVVDRFGKIDDDGNIIYGKDQGIIDKFEKFTWSKLCLLTSVPDQYLDQFYSSMTAKQIREKKADIVKLINKSDESKLIDDSDAAISIPSQSDLTVHDDFINSEIRDDLINKHSISLYSFTSIEELRPLLLDNDLISSIENRVDRLNNDTDNRRLFHIEVVLSYSD